MGWKLAAIQNIVLWLGGWALCREAGHDTAMPARTHGQDTALGVQQVLSAGRCASGRAAGARGARQARGALAERAGQGWLGAGRAAWARGLGLGCALGALDLFLARFDSVFS